MSEHSRFLDKIDSAILIEDGCWKWKGASYRDGYGHFRRKIGDRWVMYKAHRYSYETFRGPIQDKNIILHTCNNPACVNPDHLEQGTHQENTAHMIACGRKVFGINPNHKYHGYALAKDIRNYHKEFPQKSCKELAEHFQTSSAQVSRILNNKIWKSPEEL